MKKASFYRLLRDESGVTSIEYALIAVFVSVALIAGATLIGNSLSNTFNKASTNLAAATR